jgi:hypothetical protein
LLYIKASWLGKEDSNSREEKEAAHETIRENIGEECLKSLTCSKIGQKSKKIGVMNGKKVNYIIEKKNNALETGQKPTTNSRNKDRILGNIHNRSEIVLKIRK